MDGGWTVSCPPPTRKSTMSHIIRARGNGRTVELRIKHRLLEKPVYFTFASESAASQFGERADAMLARGVVPAGLLPAPTKPFLDIAGAISEYRGERAVAQSSADMLVTLSRDIGSTALASIDIAWAKAWVRAQKLEHLRAPGTIRHHVGALRRCLDWVVHQYPACLSHNPLHELHKGYATYSPNEKQVLARLGLVAKEDCERNRRLAADEESRILATLESDLATAQDPQARAHYEGLQLAFTLALETAMRMREIYTLTLDQIDLTQRTIFLTKTKNGDSREVPLSSVACEQLTREWPALVSCRSEGRLLPFWNGDLDPKNLKNTSANLSRDYAKVFAAARCDDLHFHDLRHEATCRLVLRTRLSETAISRITGHKSPRMLRRYMSLRGSELAELLW